MKMNKYIYIAYMILCTLISFSSCTDEEFVGKHDNKDYNSVSLRVKMPTPIVSEPMTKAGTADFDQMKDLNVVIGENNQILGVAYLSLTSDGKGSWIVQTPPSGIINVSNNSSTANAPAFGLHFTSHWLNEKKITLTTNSQVFLVANFGKEITGISSVSELKKLTTPEDGNAIMAPNVMFGEGTISNESTANHPEGDTSPGNILVYDVALQRTAAMITVVMKGKSLNEGIVITPKRISLYNVPTSCFIGMDNVVTTEQGGTTPKENAVRSEGEVKDGLGWSGGINLVGTETKNWENFNNASYSTTIGKHYDQDFTDQTVFPLFLYENIHGDNFGANESNQKNKRPAAAKSSTEADIWAVAAACSYIEVEADYVKYENNSMTVKQKGTTKWRFFLGENATTNFDVHRNTNYKLTLTLSGTGIGEGNASWRVDSELKEPVVVGETEMVVGGGGEMFCVELISPPEGNKLKLSGSEDANFVYVYAKNGSTTQWWPLSEFKGAGDMILTGEGKQMWFYVSPLLPETSDVQGNERSATVGFYDQQIKPGSLITEVTFTQYRPITVEIGWDDVKDESDEDMVEVKKLITKYYNYTFKEGNDPFVFYVDRIDRNPMPWGFNTVQLDHNHSSGFENVYHLIDPKGPDEEGHCKAHQDFAIHYLPTGKGWQETPGSYVNYANGSCMMHAAMENDFQKYDPCPPANITPTTLLQTQTLPKRPNENEQHSYGWCVPSIVGWQLLEKMDKHEKEHGNKLGIFDVNHPISKWTSYWTSNAETTDMADDNRYSGFYVDGKTKAFVYQFDMKLDKIDKNQVYPGYLLLPRTTPLKYRLINIDPKYFKEVEDIEPNTM